jgi:RNA polymerase sigma-70 factor (ECF subfamily)
MNAVLPARAMPAADSDVLAKIASGDLSSLGVLFDRYAIDVRRFVARLGIDSADLDDLTQATFLTAMDVAGSFQSDGLARSWLFGIAANLVRRHRRSLARMAARLSAWTRERDAHEGSVPPDTLFEARDQLAMATRALACLSAKKREVFVMVVLEGIPAEDVGRMLHIPVNTVFTRLHHARREIRGHVFKGRAR